MSKKNKPVKEKNLVDIVIPVYGKYDLLEKCINSIPEAFGDTLYKIYIVDDKSPDYDTVGKELYKKFRESLPRLGGILAHDKNYGYPKSCNDGVNLGSSPIIFILSTDVLLTKDCGKILCEHNFASPEVGITFPKLLFNLDSIHPDRPAGKLQHCGIFFDIQQNPHHKYIGFDPNHPFVTQVRDIDACTGAVFAIKRSLFFKLKGFDEAYGFGTWEDCDLCLRVRMSNYKIRYLPQTMAYHGVGQSAEGANKPFPMNQNRNYFRLKFGDKIPYSDWIY